MAALRLSFQKVALADLEAFQVVLTFLLMNDRVRGCCGGVTRVAFAVLDTLRVSWQWRSQGGMLFRGRFETRHQGQRRRHNNDRMTGDGQSDG